MSTELLAIIGATAGVGIPAIMSLVGWLWTSREKDARDAVKSQHDAEQAAQREVFASQQRRLEDHEERLRVQESGEAFKEIRKEIREDMRALGESLRSNAESTNRQLSLMQGELAGMRNAHRPGDFGNPPTGPGGR